LNDGTVSTVTSGELIDLTHRVFGLPDDDLGERRPSVVSHKTLYRKSEVV